MAKQSVRAVLSRVGRAFLHSSKQCSPISAVTGWRGVPSVALVLASLALIALVQPLWAAQPASHLSASAMSQIQALQDEKASRTPAQLKMDSQLVYALKLQRKDPALAAVPMLQAGVEVSETGQTLMDIRATSTADLPAFLASIGATVVSNVGYTVRARVPMARAEEVAARPEVRWVMPAARFMLNRNTSEGDTSHGAAWVRAHSALTGAGQRVGIISDSDDYLAAMQGTGDLPATIPAANAGPGVTEVPGQTGVPGTGEGSGMMEIVYDLAPNAHLFFATANGSPAQFGANIQTLAGAPYNCNIIIDDMTYYIETPFHLGDSGHHSTTGAADVINAVNTVVAGGVIYLSSAANDNNLDQGFSGTWEGDFASGGALPPLLPEPVGSLVHNFGGGQIYDILVGAAGDNDDRVINLWWNDPLGGSNNDYDLFLVDSGMTTVLFASMNFQTGTQDSQESLYLHGATHPYVPANPRIMIVRGPLASARFLHLGTNRGQLSIGTSGATRGHNAIGGYTVAATPALYAGCSGFPAGPYPAEFTTANKTECFSSDGLRRVFFDAAGGSISQTLNKPDFTAADGTLSQWIIDESTGAHDHFFGTSAAAPHAGAIAALLKSGGYTNAQVINAMKTTAIDIMAAGFDRDAGQGIVMADNAYNALAPCVLTCPSDITVSNDTGQCGAVVTFTVGSSGSCGTIAATPASGSLFPIGTTTVNVTSTLGGSCSFHVKVNDTQHPTITCPQDFAVKAPDDSGAIVTYPAAVVADNCPGVTVTYNPPSGSKLPVGDTLVTATATDASGNTAICTFHVGVQFLIPMLSTWALIGLAVVLLVLGLLLIRSRLSA